MQRYICSVGNTVIPLDLSLDRIVRSSSYNIPNPGSNDHLLIFLGTRKQNIRPSFRFISFFFYPHIFIFDICVSMIEYADRYGRFLYTDREYKNFVGKFHANNYFSPVKSQIIWQFARLLSK